MRISDWSSDVCSSDLGGRIPDHAPAAASRSAFFLRSEADLSWPQAARMSSPRVARTGAEICAAESLSAKRVMVAASEHSKKLPGQGLKGMRFTLAGMPFSRPMRSEEHTSELQSLLRISYAVFCL